MYPEKIAALLLLMFISLFSNAQQQTDVVYLKNGSVIKGTITEKTDNTLSIKTCCENLWVFNNNEIQKMETLDKPLPGYLKTRGYYNFTSMGFLIGSSMDENPAIVSILMEHNYQVNPHFSVGGVTGIEFFNESVMPLGLNIKGILSPTGKSAFYINGSLGYSFPVEDLETDNYYNYKDSRGGIFTQTDVGVVFPSQSNLNFFMSIGYRYNELNYVREDWYYNEIDRKVKYNRFALKFGIAFH